MDTQSIRKLFIKFFQDNNHIYVKESPLTLKNDKSLLFTNSGMAQFKTLFLGEEKAIYKNIVTSQKCIRIGGKHNDLTHIGISPYHNTSFEMLGNFSFMNYFKIEAINLAWRFLTENLYLNKKQLYVTIHKDDIETLNIWIKYTKINKTNIILGTNKTNFWNMEKTGPCGYCSEIFYKFNNNLLEIWNLVFIQFNKIDENNTIKLKHHAIDTGLGLERISLIMQNVNNIFKLDTIKSLIDITTKTLEIKIINKNIDISIKIITDHIKTCIILINDGTLPSNVGRGYVIKKLIRRALIYKQKTQTFIKLYTLIPLFITHLNTHNHNIKNHNNIITYIFKYEEEKFSNTLEHGTKHLTNILKNKNTINGKNLFLLYDTYGFPLELIKEITDKKNITIDLIGFNKELTSQKNKSNKFTIKSTTHYDNIRTIKKTNFIGYTHLNTLSEILYIMKNNKNFVILNENEEGIIITKTTTFFTEKSGQIYDTGLIINNDNIFYVQSTQEYNNIYLHKGIVKSGTFKIKDHVNIKVDQNKRKNTSINHSATHLLYAALIQQLGKHIKQTGSLIKPEYFTFDFTHFKPLCKNELIEIENIVNKHIQHNLTIKTTIKDHNKTNENDIRVVNIGNNISNELCTGTHINNTKEIKLFKIIKEYSIGTSTRRIEAITEKYAIQLINENNNIINTLTGILKTNNAKLIDSINSLLTQNKTLKKYCKNLETELIKNLISTNTPYINKNHIKIITIDLKYINLHINLFKYTINKHTKSIILFHKTKGNVFITTIYITIDLIQKLPATNIINFLKQHMNCNGNGTSQMATVIIKNNNTDNIKNINLYINKYINNIT